MGILSTTDALYFAPSLASLSPDDLGAIVNYVNFLVESPDGANRQLDIKKWTEKLKMNVQLQNVYLSYRPLILDNPIDYPISVKVRIANTLNYYGRGFPLQPWREIPMERVILDVDGQLHITFSADYFYLFLGYGLSIRPIATEMQVSYYSGLNIVPYIPYQNTQIEKEILDLKVAAGEICKYLNSKLYNGISSVQVPFDEFTVGFNNPDKAFRVPQELLYPFKKYKPYLKA
jgi:hypothetical protein